MKKHKKLVKSKKRLFPFTSSFYFLTILARLSLLLLMAFIISKIFLSTLFPPKKNVYASYCCEVSLYIDTLPAYGYWQECTIPDTPSYIYTLPFTVGSTTYYQLPASGTHFRVQAGVCK